MIGISDVRTRLAPVGEPGTRFSNFAYGWQVSDAGRAVLQTARLQTERDPGDWRLLLERGDLAPLVRPEG